MVSAVVNHSETVHIIVTYLSKLLSQSFLRVWMGLGGQEATTVESYDLAYLTLSGEARASHFLFQTPAKIRGEHLEVHWGSLRC